MGALGDEAVEFIHKLGSLRLWWKESDGIYAASVMGTVEAKDFLDAVFYL